ncbi:MAG TPA: PDZ domain-containing protein [Actinomycetota bacterium]|nr:PDZ domain-containing protein [Actinomycetota bacterium]
MSTDGKQATAWRRATWWTGLFSLLGVIGVLGTSVRLPILVLEPGPAPDVAQRTRIEAPTFDSEGSIHLTTALVDDPKGATAKEVVEAMMKPDQILYPREAIYPSDASEEHTQSVQAAQMTQSELEAAVAALSELGMAYQPEGAFVADVVQTSPAAKKLRAGDVITAVDGRPVVVLKDLTSVVDNKAPGDPVRLEVLREGRRRSFSVAAVEPPSREFSRLGAELVQYNKPPVEVSISSTDIGGPSAGLMYALSIYDRLVEDDLTGGRKIAGTGTIENTGEQNGVVGAVGSIGLKVKAADRIGAAVFVVPKAEVEEAREAAGPEMEVIGVSTLHEAIAELKKLTPNKVAQNKS